MMEFTIDHLGKRATWSLQNFTAQENHRAAVSKMRHTFVDEIKRESK